MVGLIASNACGAVFSLLGRPAVQAVVVSVVCMFGATLLSMASAWLNRRLAKYPALAADVVALERGLAPMLREHSPELVAAVVAKLAHQMPPPAPTLVPPPPVVIT